VLATTHISLAVETRRRDAPAPGSTAPKGAKREEPTVPLTRTEPPGEPSGGPERR
jgi:hypothetical protein